MMTADSQDISGYYTRRASEYDRIYDKPERQDDLSTLRAMVAEHLAGHHVLEVACGTGYWTEPISRTAVSVIVTDINEEVLERARVRPYRKDNVRFLKTDAFSLAEVHGHFSAAFMGFFWSHIPVNSVKDFLATLHGKLSASALVVVIDNVYVEGSNTPISRRDWEGNTYQRRTLEDGSIYEVIKNFPGEQELCGQIRGRAVDVRFTALEYYWCLTYRVSG